MIFTDPTWTLKPPRKWQSSAFRTIASHYATPNALAGMVRAVMGSGKSLLIAELCATLEHDSKSPIVVITCSKLLVEQIRKTIVDRVKTSKSVGMYYSKRKDSGTDIIVCCDDSAQQLGDALSSRNRRCSFLVIDEAHKSECETILKAKATLNPASMIGFTATPFRASHSQSISLFEKLESTKDGLLINYGPQEALADGVVVPFRIEGWTEDKSDLDEACIQMIRTANGPGICNASNIADAIEFAEKLNAAGINAACIHSRMNSDDQQQRINQLKAGEIRCLVHVNMLVEGADYPWLMWMCLRRDVDSRVRFLQEIGRGLRACDEIIWNKFKKSECVFYDPNDLFGSHKITYEAALGAEQTEEEQIEDILELPPDAICDAVEKMPEATGMRMFELELRRLVVACDAAGMCPERVIVKKDERVKAPSAIQLLMIPRYHNLALQYIVPSWTRFFDLIVQHCGKINKGACTDLCVILSSIENNKRFPPISHDGRIEAAISEPEETVLEEPKSVQSLEPLERQDQNRKIQQMELEFS